MAVLRSLLLPLVVHLASCEVHASSSAEGPLEPGNRTSRIPLNFILMLSNSSSYNSWGSIPAVDIALEMVDESGLLGEYKLQYSTPGLDSHCDRTQSLDMFLKVVIEKENDVNNVGLIGAGCSTASLPVAEISHHYNIPMISWTSSAAELSNRNRFRNFYRTVPSVEFHSSGVAALLDFYGWGQVAILTEVQSLFVNDQKVIKRLLPEVDIVIREFDSTDDPLQVDDLFVQSHDMRIFVLNMYVNKARRILCEASQRGMYYPRYTWITPGWYGDEWWTWDIPDECTEDDMTIILSNSLSVLEYTIVNETQVSQLGLSANDFRYIYRTQLELEYHQRGILYKPDFASPLAFDAVWSLAFALNLTRGKIARGEEGRCAGMQGDLVPLEQFDYRNKKLGCLLQESMDEVSFLGVTGYVKFDSTGNRVGSSIRIQQYCIGNNGEIYTPLIGYAVLEGDTVNVSHLDIQYSTNSTVWPDGITPDGVPIQTTVTTALALTITYSILAGIGILFALVCLIFQILFRNNIMIVRMTIPKLNYLIIAGAIFIYLSVIFWVLPAKEELLATVFCNFRVWLFSIGNTLCLATVLSKMWRVISIFSSVAQKKNRKYVRDQHLLIIISVIVSVDVIILLVPTAIKSARARGQLTQSKEHPATTNHLGVRREHFYYSCYSDSQVILLFISYVYQFLLQVAAIFFAFMSHKVEIKALNDSKQIKAIIYITSLLLVISAFGFWISHGYLNTSTTVFGAAELLMATIILGLVFIPKMVNLHQENLQIHMPSSLTTFGAESKQTIQEMSQRIKELESELARYQMESGGNSVNTVKTATPTQKSCNASVKSSFKL